MGTGVAIPANEGQALTNVVVATFTESDLGNTSRVNFVASINWGDGSPTSAGTITPNGTGRPTTISRAAAYLWPLPGTYNVNVTLTDLGSSGTTVVGGATIDVTSNGPVNSTPNPIVSSAGIVAAPLLAQGVPITGTEGTALNPAAGGDVLVATFMDTDTVSLRPPHMPP